MARRPVGAGQDGPLHSHSARRNFPGRWTVDEEVVTVTRLAGLKFQVARTGSISSAIAPRAFNFAT